jgi:hypothetical protein
MMRQNSGGRAKIRQVLRAIPEPYDRVCEIVTECFQKETGSIPRIKRK